MIFELEEFKINDTSKLKNLKVIIDEKKRRGRIKGIFDNDRNFDVSIISYSKDIHFGLSPKMVIKIMGTDNIRARDIKLVLMTTSKSDINLSGFIGAKPININSSMDTIIEDLKVLIK